MALPVILANPFVQAFAVALFTSILGAATRPREQKYQSASDKMLDQMVKDYTRIGQNRTFAASLAAMVDPTRTADSFLGSKGDVEVLEILRADPKYGPDFTMFPPDKKLLEDVYKEEAGALGYKEKVEYTFPTPIKEKRKLELEKGKNTKMTTTKPGIPATKPIEEEEN